MKAPAPQFPGVRRPTTDFQAVQSDLQTLPYYIDIALDSARSLAAGTALTLPIAGNAIYVDQKTKSGYATLYFQDNAFAGNTPITAFPGWGGRVPFTQVLVENIAQPGLTLRLVYGVDIDFQPSSAAGVALLAPVDVNDYISPNTAVANVQNAANTVGWHVQSLIAASSNPNGLVLRNLQNSILVVAGPQSGALLVVAALNAPTNNAGGGNRYFIKWKILPTTASETADEPIFINRRIPAGWGVWSAMYISAALEVDANTMISYEAL